MDYRKKSFLLVALTLLLLVLSYQVAIRKTLDLRKENIFFISSVESMSLNEIKIGQITRRLSKMDSLLTDRGQRGNTDILKQVGILCQENGVRIKSIADPQIQGMGAFSIQTLDLKLEGDFVSLVKVIYQLEKRPVIGRVASVNFKTERVNNSKIKRLYCDLYVQRYESTAKE